MECHCENENAGNAVPDWWLNGSNTQMGAFAVVGYLLYRFSQTLPALIRWPIRFFCSVTGLSALWGWVSHLVRTLRGIQSLVKWLSRVWRFLVAFSSRFKWLAAVIKAITVGHKFGVGGSREGSSESQTGPNLTGELFSTSASHKPGLRLILLGPSGGGRTSLADTLLGTSEARMGPLMQSSKRRGIVDGRELIIIDTPDVLGTSLGDNKRAREALRSLQLTSPGPHAFLLVIGAQGSSEAVDQDAVQAVRATLELFGEGVTRYIIPVLTHADRLGRRHTADQLTEADAGSLKRATSLCGQGPVLVESGPDLPPQAQSVLRRHLVGCVMEMKEQKGHFVHELQRREDHLREELLADMSSTLAGKLGHA